MNIWLFSHQKLLQSSSLKLSCSRRNSFKAGYSFLILGLAPGDFCAFSLSEERESLFKFLVFCRGGLSLEPLYVDSFCKMYHHHYQGT